MSGKELARTVLGYIMLPILYIILRLRWVYFHVHPGYTKFYMDSAGKEAHFFHTRTNSIHSDIRLI